MEVVHEGWLLKSPPPKRLWRAKWRTRWFVLRSGEIPGQYFLEYYVDNSKKKIKGKIDLDQCEQVDAGITFTGSKLDYKHMFDIKTPKRVYYLCAQTEEEMNKWVDCVCQVCGLKVENQDDGSFNSYPAVYQMNHPSSSHSADPLGVDQIHLESPPLSPQTPGSTISGPYIPLATCVSGTKGSVGTTCFPFGEAAAAASLSALNENSARRDFSYDVKCPLKNNTAAKVAGSTVGAQKEGVDPQKCIKVGLCVSESPVSKSDLVPPKLTSGESWSITPPCDAKFADYNSESASASALVEFPQNKNTHLNVPPRPPKPAHLVDSLPQQNYQNLDAIMKESLNRKYSVGGTGSSLSNNNSQENSISEAELSPSSVASSVYLISPKEENNKETSNYINFENGPLKMAAGSVKKGHINGSADVISTQAFLYDVCTQRSAEKTCKDFDFHLMHLSHFSNSQPSKSTHSPPAVDRGLKPRHREFGSTSSSEVSPLIYSGQAKGATASSGLPLVDRNLKPAMKCSDASSLSSANSFNSSSKSFALDPVPKNRLKNSELRKPLTTPSPTPPVMRNGADGAEDEQRCLHSVSRRNSANNDEQVIFPLHPVSSKSPDSIQYLDLDLDVNTDLRHSPKSHRTNLIVDPTASAKVPPSVVYKTVDFVKTVAFNKTKQNVEDTYRKNQ